MGKIHFSHVQMLLKYILGSIAVLTMISPKMLATVKYVPNDYATISAAVAASSAGDTVRVFAGTYEEHVNINKSLVVIGSGTYATPDSVTTILAPSDFQTNTAYNYSLPNFSDERTIVHIGDSVDMRVALKGFTVDGNRLGTTAISYSAILAESCTVTLDSNIIKNVLPSLADSGAHTHDPTFNGRGIHVRGSNAVGAITNNQLVDINRYLILINASDNQVNPSVFPTATVTGNTILGKGLYAGAQKGVWFNNGAWGTISRNTVTNMDYPEAAIEPERASGIVVRRGYLNTVNRNVITQNVISSSLGSFVNNKGIYDEGTGDSVADNRVSNYRFGIQIHNADNVVAYRDTVTGGQVGFVVSRTQGTLVGPYTITIGGSPANRCVITGQQPSLSGGSAIALSFRDVDADGTLLSTVPVDARYNDLGVYSEAQVQQSIWDRADTTATGVDTVYYSPFYVDKIRASVKVFLQGPYVAAGDSMARTLNTNGTLAAHFGAIPIPALAVDSINIELRNSTTVAGSTTRKYAPAWLLTNGTIRNFSDTTKSYVEFDTTLVGSYYLAVRHRNHLSVLSSRSQLLDGSSLPNVYDFSDSLSKSYITMPMIKPAGASHFAMFGGDADGNSGIGASDIVGERGTIGSTTYNVNDVDMNGGVGASDLVLSRANIGQTSVDP